MNSILTQRLRFLGWASQCWGVSYAYSALIYSALMTALWTAFQPAAVMPQLLVEFLLPLILTLRLLIFLLALIPMTQIFFSFNFLIHCA